MVFKFFSKNNLQDPSGGASSTVICPTTALFYSSPVLEQSCSSSETRSGEDQQGASGVICSNSENDNSSPWRWLTSWTPKPLNFSWRSDVHILLKGPWSFVSYLCSHWPHKMLVSSRKTEYTGQTRQECQKKKNRACYERNVYFLFHYLLIRGDFAEE